jgi:hypothetical protein
MSLSALCKVIVSASLVLACGHTQPQPPLAPLASASSDYVTIIPEVTYSPTGQGPGSDAMPVSSDEDVMAGILAIPPGSHGRLAPAASAAPRHPMIRPPSSSSRAEGTVMTLGSASWRTEP